MTSTVPVTESGPLDDPDSTIADCRQDPQWALAGHGPLPEAGDAPFPGDATASAESKAICSRYVADPSEVSIAYLPSRADWTTGSRDIDCWVGQTEVGSGQSA